MTAPNLGELADQIATNLAKIAKINQAAAVKTAPLIKYNQELQEQLELAMIDAGVTSISGKKAEAELKEKLRVGFADWEEFIAFAKKHNAFHLLPRSINVVPYRELIELRKGKAIPGLSEFQQTTLNVKVKKA